MRAFIIKLLKSNIEYILKNIIDVDIKAQNQLELSTILIKNYKGKKNF
jgi:hypothetical protein